MGDFMPSAEEPSRSLSAAAVENRNITVRRRSGHVSTFEEHGVCVLVQLMLETRENGFPQGDVLSRDPAKVIIAPGFFEDQMKPPANKILKFGESRRGRFFEPAENSSMAVTYDLRYRVLLPVEAKFLRHANNLWGLNFIFSALMAPVMMLLHAGFIMNILLSEDSGWKGQQRDDRRGTGLRDAISAHWVHTLLGLAAWVVTYRLSLFLLFLPVTAGLALSIPLSIFSSRMSTGQWARRLGLFVIPEETVPPLLLARTEALRREFLSLPPDDHAVPVTRDAAVGAGARQQARSPGVKRLLAPT